MSSIGRFAIAATCACAGAAALLAGCAPHHVEHNARLWPAPRQCPWRAPSDSGPAAVAVAVKCAEEFISRNGYTLKPPTWSTADLAEESFESGISWGNVLRRRRGSLRSEPIAVCTGASDRDDMSYTVVFPYGDHTVTAVARMVTMDHDFGQLRVQQQNVRLRALDDTDLGCQPWPPPKDKGTTN
jgi:hypothetical protein